MSYSIILNKSILGEMTFMDKMDIIMPSQGDMELISQENGILSLKPIYYGGECAGPIIKFGNTAYRLKLRANGKLELKGHDTAIIPEATNDQ